MCPEHFTFYRPCVSYAQQRVLQHGVIAHGHNDANRKPLVSESTSQFGSCVDPYILIRRHNGYVSQAQKPKHTEEHPCRGR